MRYLQAGDLHRLSSDARRVCLNCEVAMTWITVLALLACSATASTQTAPANTWSRGTTVAVAHHFEEHAVGNAR